MTVCDSCEKKILNSDTGFTINIQHGDASVRYDGCSVECCAKIFHNLAEQWDKDSRNQS